MPQSTTEANVITSQPLINSMNMAEPNPVLENPAEVITTQPMINDPNDEEQKKKNQFVEMHNQSNSEVAEDCVWCCFTCTDCAQSYDCTGCCDGDCTGCCDADGTGCCDGDGTGCCDGDGTGCCDGDGTGCCDSGPSVDNVDGADVAGCLDCCGACCDGCSD